MIQKESLAKNFIFQFLYQAVVLIIPLILSPYLTRTLHETALGIYSYVHSISYYFVVVANLGIARHGQRLIAQNRDDDDALRKSFWSLFSFHALFSLLIVVCYLFFIVFFVKENSVVYYIEAFFVFSALFDITWLFYGIENFKSVVTKNLIIKIIQCICIFAFVHDPSDLNIYTAICALSVFCGHVVMIPQAIRMIRPVRFGFADVKIHIKPLLVLAIAVVASTLYTTFDMTLLGLLTNKENVAFYSYSNQIVSIPNTIIGVVGTVMFPKACKLAADGDFVGQKKYIGYSVLIVSLISFGSIFGLLAVSDLFATTYYGESFAACGGIIKALSPIVLFIGIGSVLRAQFLIPNGMDKQFTVCIIYNAVINLVLSTLLIPMLGTYGAVIGTVSAEGFGMAYQLFLCRKFIRVSDIIKTAIPFALIGTVMYVAVRLIACVLSDAMLSLAVQVISGLVIYCLLSFAYIVSFKPEIKSKTFAIIKSKFQNKKS